MPVVAPVSLLFNGCKYCASLIIFSSEIKYCEITTKNLTNCFRKLSSISLITFEKKDLLSYQYQLNVSVFDTAISLDQCSK